MFAKCVKKTGAELGPYRRGLLYMPETRYDLVIDKAYRVYAMAMINNALTLLVSDEYDRPAWLPIDLFEFEETDPSLPAHWEFKYFGDTRSDDDLPGQLTCQARWGYTEVVQSDEHFYGLEDRNVEALRVFYQERERLEKS